MDSEGPVTVLKSEFISLSVCVNVMQFAAAAVRQNR
jgi:hypothetical protein